MFKINEMLLELSSKYSFKKVSAEVNEFKNKNPEKNIVSLGIGDVSLPIVKPIIDAMHKAVDDLSDISSFRGYGAYYGYDFLKEKILQNDYKSFNFSCDEIYISDGTKTDVSNILELFDINSSICIPSVIYPIYKSGATCLNRNTVFLPANEKNNFLPNIPSEKYDIIYICSPNNPLGIAYTKEELTKWVEYANKHNSIILYDNVYYSFIQDENIPKSIYEIENATKVAIEFRSFSKKASFTGVRCSYYVIPNEINKNINLHWKNRTINRFNGVNYITQRGAEASYVKEAKELLQNNINYYLNNAKLLRNCFVNLGFEVMGGINSPFLWVKTKDNMNSWDYFKFMLEKLNIVIIPGCVFGDDGDNYFRLSSLGNTNDIKEAIKRIEEYYEKEN